MKRNLFLVLMFVLSTILFGCGINLSPGTGEKIGQIVKINKQGLFSSTWEAELIRGGLSGGNGTIGMQPFDFTVEDDAIAQKLQGYLESQTEVIVKYRISGLYSLFSTEHNGTFLTNIEPAKKN